MVDYWTLRRKFSAPPWEQAASPILSARSRRFRNWISVALNMLWQPSSPLIGLTESWSLLGETHYTGATRPRPASGAAAGNRRHGAAPAGLQLGWRRIKLWRNCHGRGKGIDGVLFFKRAERF